MCRLRVLVALSNHFYPCHAFLLPLLVARQNRGDEYDWGARSDDDAEEVNYNEMYEKDEVDFDEPVSEQPPHLTLAPTIYIGCCARRMSRKVKPKKKKKKKGKERLKLRLKKKRNGKSKSTDPSNSVRLVVLCVHCNFASHPMSGTQASRGGQAKPELERQASTDSMDSVGEEDELAWEQIAFNALKELFLQEGKQLREDKVNAQWRKMVSILLYSTLP